MRKEGETMLADPMEMMIRFPVRKSKVQKKSFLDAVASYAGELNFSCGFGKKYLRIGGENAAYFLYARYHTSIFHDDTTALLTVLEILRTLPQMHRERVSVVLYEGKPILPDSGTAILLEDLNRGSEIRMVPSGTLMADAGFSQLLKRCTGWFGRRQIRLMKPTGHKHKLLRITSVAAKKKGPKPNTKDPDMTTVNILRACISTLISTQ